jgi:hypothetical protein
MPTTLHDLSVDVHIDEAVLDRAHMSGTQPSRFHWLASAIALAGAATLVYWWRLGRPLWVDEEMIALNARWRSFGDLAGALWLDQTAPLGWVALERLALQMFGVSERAARALPVLFGIGTLAVAVWVGRRWMTPLGAAILAALCSIAPWLVFFTLELKQYSADTCWALLLPALAAWAAEAETRDRVMRRAAVWWTVAAGGLWLSNGATFVAPACAAVLVGRAWQRHGMAAAAAAAAPGIIWLISFAGHYALALRYALENEYLRNYWSFAFPPANGGVGGTLQWARHWIESFAVKPAGTSRWVMFWAAITGGFVYATARYGPLGVAFAAIPVSALALGLFRIVPPFERLGLWSVPALYVGLALCADAALWIGVQRRLRPAPLRVASAIAAILATGIVSLDIARNGRAELGAKRADDNYGLDDRRAVRRVETLRHSGDPVLTTHFGLPGLWWYGGVNIAGPRRGAYLDDSPLFEISHERRRSRCARHSADMDALIQRTGRAIVYLGFRMNVEPPGFDRLVFDELSRRGAVVAYGRYAELSHVAAFDFTQPPDGDGQKLFVDSGLASAPSLTGCVALRPARRW